MACIKFHGSNIVSMLSRDEYFVSPFKFFKWCGTLHTIRYNKTKFAREIIHFYFTLKDETYWERERERERERVWNNPSLGLI
jgi:hypothetical protein